MRQVIAMKMAFIAFSNFPNKTSKHFIFLFCSFLILSFIAFDVCPFEQIQNGATFVIVDKTTNPRDGTPALLIQGIFLCMHVDMHSYIQSRMHADIHTSISGMQ